MNKFSGPNFSNPYPRPYLKNSCRISWLSMSRTGPNPLTWRTLHHIAKASLATRSARVAVCPGWVVQLLLLRAGPTSSDAYLGRSELPGARIPMHTATVAGQIFGDKFVARAGQSHTHRCFARAVEIVFAVWPLGSGARKRELRRREPKDKSPNVASCLREAHP